MSKEHPPKKFYYPSCKKCNCNGVLLIKFINDNFSLDYECEKNKEHQEKNIYFNTFERFYLKENEISNCSKCHSKKASHKCKICENNYCSPCSLFDEHIKQNNNNAIKIYKDCPIHNDNLNNYCIHCQEYLCDSCSEEEKHNEHTIKSLVDMIPSKKEIKELNNRMKYYDELIKKIDEWHKELIKKIEILKKSIMNEKKLIQKLIQDCNNKFLSYTYFLNFKELSEYTKSFNSDILEEFYLSNNYERKTELIMKYLVKSPKLEKVDIEYPFIKNAFEGKLEKINDDYYLNYSSENGKVLLVKYDHKKGKFNIITHSKYNIDDSIRTVDCEKFSEQIYYIYASLYEERKIIILECDLNNNIISKKKDEITCENAEINGDFLKCIELNKNDFLATATTKYISVWIKKNNENGYFLMQNLIKNESINDILSINEDYFIGSINSEIYFFNKKTLQIDKIIINLDCFESKNSLFLFKNFILVICQRGIRIISIKTKEYVQYIENDKDFKYKGICINNNIIYAIKIKENKKSYDFDKKTDPDKDVNIVEYKLDSGELKPIKIHLPYNKEVLNDEETNLSIFCLDPTKLLILGKNSYEMRLRFQKEFIEVARLSHITSSGKCIGKKKL